MEPLCNFDNKEMAFLYYVEVCRMSPVSAKHYIDENWDKTHTEDVEKLKEEAKALQHSLQVIALVESLYKIKQRIQEIEVEQ